MSTKDETKALPELERIAESYRHATAEPQRGDALRRLYEYVETAVKYEVDSLRTKQAEQSLDEAHRIASRQASDSAVKLDAASWEPINNDRPLSFTDGTIAHLLDLLEGMTRAGGRGSRSWEEAMWRVADWALVVAQEHYDRGVAAASKLAEPVPLEPAVNLEHEANSYRFEHAQLDTFSNLIDRAVNLAKGGYTPQSEINGLRKMYDFDAHHLAAVAYRDGFKRGVNSVYDDAESGIDRKGFVVFCQECRYMNRYPGGFAPGKCGNCGEDLSDQPRYREVDREGDVPVFEPIARASHHDAAFSAATGEYALIKLYCQPHQAEKVYAAALEIVDRKGEAISGPWYGPGVAKERSADLLGESEPAATCRQCGCTDLDCSRCLERTGEPCHWVEPDLCSACAAEDRNREHEHKEELNAAYSDGYRTGKMHAGRAARFLAGEDLEDTARQSADELVTKAHGDALMRFFASGVSYDRSVELSRFLRDLVDQARALEPAAETPLVYVTVSRKGKITASGPAPAVLAVLRGVLDLEDEPADVSILTAPV